MADDTAEQQTIASLIDTTNSVEHQYFQAARSKNVRLLTEQGRRQRKSLVIFAAYRLGEFDNTGRNFIEKVLGNLEFYYHKAFGKQKTVPVELLKSLIADAFNNGYLPFKAMLEAMGLKARPLTVTELWDDLWATFNIHNEFNSVHPGLGYHLVLEDNSEAGAGLVLYEDFKDEQYSDIEPLSLVISQSFPKARRAYVELGGELIGVVGLEEKPAAFTSASQMLTFVWGCN